MNTENHWKKVGKRIHHGICLPLFSLRTQTSCGIGEFLDLIPLIAWCKAQGFDCLQLLPLNDTGSDASPYNPISSCALDPIYLSLRNLPEAGNLSQRFAPFEPLNQAPLLMRQDVKRLKMEWLYLYFEKKFSFFANTENYQLFLLEHSWVFDYARFKTCKDAFGGRHWKEWPALHAENQTAMDFYSFLQYLCFSQLEQVRHVADKHSFFIKGDLPLFLSPDSADVWAHRSLFRLDLVAGAPPDQYNLQGQKWGFALYDWNAMRQGEFSWWKQRLKVLEKLYHIYRIDHVIGLFRVWAIAEEKQAIEGEFIPSEPETWFQQGRKILEMMLSACELLPIAEDLGTIPPKVRVILKELGICGTKVIRWEAKDQNYIPYSDYEPLSMTTISTPDIDPLPLWWQHFPDEAKAFARFKNWTYHPFLTKEEQAALLQDAHHTASFFHINLLQEYLLLFPELSWPELEVERVNYPGTELPTNWTYRFRPYLEEIVCHDGLSKMIRSFVQ